MDLGNIYKPVELASLHQDSEDVQNTAMLFLLVVMMYDGESEEIPVSTLRNSTSQAWRPTLNSTTPVTRHRCLSNDPTHPQNHQHQYHLVHPPPPNLTLQNQSNPHLNHPHPISYAPSLQHAIHPGITPLILLIRKIWKLIMRDIMLMCVNPRDVVVFFLMRGFWNW